jgi:hypothetical protein
VSANQAMDPLRYLFCNSIAECTFVFETLLESWGSDREIAETVLIPGWSCHVRIGAS